MIPALGVLALIGFLWWWIYITFDNGPRSWSGYPPIKGRTKMEGPRCLQEGSDCEGKVEYHLNPDRDDLKTFPRCEFHQRKRLEQAEKNRQYMSDIPPSWFDPTYAGERWEED